MRGDKSGQLLLMLRRADAWLDTLAGDVPPDAQAADPDLARSALALLVSQALETLDLSPGPDWVERAQAFDARDHTPHEQRVVSRYQRASELKALLGLDQPVPAPTPEDQGLRARLADLYTRQVELQAHTTPGDIDLEALDGLDTLLADYRTLQASVSPQDPALPFLCFSAASAAFAQGRGRRLAGQLKSASIAYGEAANLYAAAGEPDQADTARMEARQARFAADADIDGASIGDLARLANGIADPLERFRALMRLSDRSHEANDASSALAHARNALDALATAGFARFAIDEGDGAAAGWIGTACQHATGHGVIRLLTEIGTARLRAAALSWQVDPAAQTPDAQARFDVLTRLLNAIVAEPARVQAEVQAGLTGYGLELDAPVAPFPSQTEQATELLRRIGDASHPSEAEDLLAQARAIGMPTLVAQACLSLAVLRLDAGDVQGCLAASHDGETVLLPNDAQAETLIGGAGFDILVELRRQRLGALSASKDTPGVFDCAWNTVRMIEAARYRVSDPLQQASFLWQRTAFYELAAITAFRLERWDDLLTAMDLFKARSAIRNRLAPPPGADAQALAARLEAATAALAAAPPEQRAALAASRRALWDLLTVTKLSKARAADLPTLSIGAIQAALGQDEAAVSWSFIAPGVLLVLAINPQGQHGERIIMDEGQQTLLAQYVAAMEAGRMNNRALGRTVSQLTSMMLPTATLAFIASANRLIFSPHRQLNLLPLHAGRVGDAYMIETASIRYVPNLASLLAPWRGNGRGVAAIGLNQSDLPGCAGLANAEAEAQAVAAVWRAHDEPVSCLLGQAVTMAGVAGFNFADARCIHIATHGSSVFLGDALADPYQSHLVLKDGFLDALSISQLSIQAEIVVTGACFSGQRALSVQGLDELPGDDMFGLQSAFYQAGARSVVGALWPLNDASAARVLPALHAGLASGMASDVALQAALKAELATCDPGDIYGWASLFLSSIGQAAVVGEASHA